MSRFYISLRYTVLFILSVISAEAFAQSLACNGGVNVSMDANCEATLNSSHILKGADRTADPSGYVLTVKNVDGTFPSDIRTDSSATGAFSGFDHVGAFLKFSHPGSYIVEVRRLSDGVRCWGDLLIEDKLLPVADTCPCDAGAITPDPRCVMSCATVPAIYQSDSLTQLAGLNPTFRDNCGNTGSISYEDILEPDTSCGGWIITRTWRSLVPDAYGILVNKDLACKQIFRFENMGVDAVHPPSSKVLVTCGIDTDPQSLRNYFSDPNIFPSAHPDTALVRSYPTLRDTLFNGTVVLRQIGQGLQGATNDNYCKITGTYTDTPIIPHCGDIGYKFVRTWHMIDWCTNATLPPLTQIIKVMDNQAPHFTIQANIPVTSTDPWTCTTDVTVPAPDTLYDNCAAVSDLTWVAYVQDGGLRVEANAANNYTLSGLSTGSYIITYVVTDACDNAASQTARVEIRDLVEPVALTRHRLKVTFTQHHDMCVAKVYPYNIDAGSFDTCDDQLDFAIRRLGDPSWSDFVKFTDLDITDVTPGGTPFGEVMVELRVRDDAGNESIGWTTVVLEDKNIVATRVCGPTEINLTCTADIDQAIEDHKPTVTLSGCQSRDLDVSHQIRATNMNNQCNTGTVVVDYFLSGSVDTICTKTFRLMDIDALQITWPAEEITVGCDDTNYGDVTISGGSCNNAIPTETFREISVPSGLGYCKKIIREITVIDWCTYQPNTGDTIGVYKYRQVIKVEDLDAPVITCTDTQTTVEDNCGRAGIAISASGRDEGACSAGLTWSAEVDVDANGSYDYPATILSNGDTLGRARIDSLLPAGTHVVRWTATDDCGNQTQETCTITVVDDVAPAIVCLGAVSTATMSTDGSVTLWASDFDVDSDVDNCGGPVSYSFSGTNPGETNKRYTCADLADGVSAVLDVVIYAWDEAGNVSSCTAKLQIDDNNDVCPDTASTAMAMIAGVIQTIDGHLVEAAQVELGDMETYSATFTQTSTEGDYAFDNNAMLGDYQLQASKSDDFLNGVTTLDLILLQRHVLGIQRLESGYDLIAADANGDGRVTALDMVSIRRLLIGITDQLPEGKSWRFIDAQQDISGDNPWPLHEKIMINDLIDDQMSANFVGIKIGDVNGSAIANSALAKTRSADKLANINIPDRHISAGELVTLNLKFDQIPDLAGLQMKLSLRQAVWVDAQSNLPDMNYETYHISEQDLSISWATTQEVAHEQDIQVTLVAQRDGSLSEIISLSKDLAPEAYAGHDIERISLALQFTKELIEDFSVAQNVPNPFNGSTTIGFEIGKEGPVEFSIFDATGRQIYAHSGTYRAGRHQLVVDQDMIQHKGVLYYQVTYDNKVSTKKMISLD